MHRCYYALSHCKIIYYVLSITLTVDMKSQSSIEFLTTYGFLFIILGIMISIIFYFTSIPKASLPMQCTSFSGPSCNYMEYYTNQTSSYGYVLMSITNSESVPINISNITITIKSTKSIGVCNPSLLYPGQEATCLTPLSSPSAPQLLVQGFYSINSKYCNNGLGSLPSANCNETANYGGAFTATASASKEYLFSVVAMRSPPTQQAPAYSSSPDLPAGFTILQNGDWISNSTFSYSFGTTGSGYVGTTYLGVKTGTFPSLVSTLGNNNVDCSGSRPYNSTFSTAYSLFYVPSAANAVFKIETDDFMAVYYKGPNVPSWTSLPGIGSLAWHGQGATEYTSNTISLASGTYYLAIMWSNACGGGMQALNASV